MAYAAHLLEEYFAGGGLPKWFSDLLNASLSNRDFLIINGVFLLVVISLAIATQQGGRTDLGIFALGVLFFSNAVIHLLASIVTVTYSPGVVSGVFIYWPLSIYIFRKIYPLLTVRQQTSGIILGLSIQVIVHLIARFI